jgi:SAM-dependent methyltransferase
MALQDHLATGQARRFHIHDAAGVWIEHWSSEGFQGIDRTAPLEKAALGLCRGRVLDVGAGAGRHSVLLQAQGLDVLPIDVEPRCVEVMQKRGLSPRCGTLFDISDEKFDTILVLQHTIGIVGSVQGLLDILAAFARLLDRSGQVLLDSSSPAYFPNGASYPGQRDLELWYGRYVGARFPWLYTDIDVLRVCGKQAGFETELVTQTNSSSDYLARLSWRE